MLRMLKITGVLLLALLLSGCYPGQAADFKNSRGALSAWIVYWDTAGGQREYEARQSSLGSVSYFAAGFDEQDQLFLPEELAALKLPPDQVSYLTIVNDQWLTDGSKRLKDKALLERLLADDASRENHVDEIIKKTRAGGFQGVEIDYEGFWKDQNLTQKYLQFTYKLCRKALEAKLKVRIVLEPWAPFDADFCRGAEYVVMLYNLYGLHSGPGPKANPAFIRSTLLKMQSLPGARSVALATGGCLWGSDGSKKLLTMEAARTVVRKHQGSLRRDTGSGCQVLSYREGNVFYELWYADDKTLRLWQGAVLEEESVNISIWRLGGNDGLGGIR